MDLPPGMDIIYHYKEDSDISQDFEEFGFGDMRVDRDRSPICIVI
jgi:hypothetical protein